MQNTTMTDDRLTEFFDRKKKEVEDRLLGPGASCPTTPAITTRLTSPITDESILSKPRILGRANLDRASQEYLAWYNEELRKTNGHLVTYVDTPLDAEVPPPVK